MQDSPASAKRFASDLHVIRQQRDVSLDAIHEATRIAIPLLKSFEDNALVDHPAFNRVYLRSLVRAYAQTIGIDIEEALQALEDALDGTYSGRLADTYAPESDASAAPFRTDSGQAEPPEGSPSDDASSSDSSVSFTVGGTNVPRSSRRASDPPPEDEQERDDKEENVAPSPITPEPSFEETLDADAEEAESTTEVPSADSSSETASKTPSETDADSSEGSLPESDVDVADSSTVADAPSATSSDEPADETGGPTLTDTPEGSAVSTDTDQENTDVTPTPGRRSSPSRSSSTPSPSSGRPLTGGSTGPNRAALIGGAVVLVLIVVGIGFFVLRGDSPSSNPPSSAAPPEPPPDTTQQAPTPPAQPPATLTLGDTLHVTVVAEGDVLGVRIRRDDDLRRPYWINAGDASVFPFERRITIEERLDSLRVLLEGYPYPTPENAERIVITRDTAEAFADTLRGDPATLSVSPDTVAIPSPS